ncbi:MAG: energy transducer TonB [Bacteroidia bacterium]
MKKLLVGLLLCAAVTVTKQTSAQTKPDSVYQKVDIKPQYTGGETALENFILTQTQYPQEALSKKQESIVEVDFVVSKNGNITDVKCTNNKYPELCNEVKRVIALMPRWTPAKVKGQAVNAHHKMAIGFKLYNKQITYVIIPDETTVSIDELIEQDIVESDPNGVDTELLSKPKRQSDEDILTFAEQMPEFDGDLSEYLSKNISYPKIAAENKIEGKVIVQFVVEKDGSISNASVIRKVGWGMDEEALRVVSNMPTWKPGKQNGKPIRVKYNLPVNFKLK